MQRHSRGYTLPLVLIVLGTLATAMTLMVVVLGASAKTTGSMIGRRQTLHACDGIIRGLMVKSRDYFAETPAPTAAGLRDFLCDPSTAPGCPPAAAWFPEMVIEEVSADTGSFDVVEEVPTGNFRGQMARRTDIALTVVAKKVATQQRCRVRQAAINSEIGLFQFAVFSAMPIELFDPPKMNITGRVHVNGDFIAGGGGPLTIEKITASGVIRAHLAGFNIIDASSGNPAAIGNSNDGDTSNWRVTSENTWHGNAQDVAWGVPLLRLPATTTAPVQGGRNAANVVKSNSGMLRILVDPPRTGDAASTSTERLANKAAIRIINGIWYKNDGSPWPGTPIWSDHPHPYDDLIDSEEADLVDAAVLGAAPPSSAGPKRYSFYETVINGAGDPILTNDALKPSIVSYGSLLPSGTAWVPGHDDGGTLVATGPDPQKLVDGTLSGFIDGRVQKDVTNGAATTADSKGRVLPLNFNVGAFIDALGDTSPGELGAHFPTGLGDNAIIWIANTWPNHDDGFPAGPAGKPPSMGDVDELSSLPLPLCGTNGAVKAFAGPTLTKTCTSTGMIAPTAVRLFNAGTISPVRLPRGLSIVSNGPVYVLGDTNTGSLNTSGLPGTPRNEDPLAGIWVPLMVGGDAVTLLSKDWSDASRRWSITAPIADRYPSGCTRDAARTTYVFAMLTGHVERTASITSGGINNMPRFLECWNNVDAVIHGSLVAGYRSVYQDQGFSSSPGPYRPPNRLWQFDENLAKPANQPPGTPSFFVSAVERWQRD